MREISYFTKDRLIASNEEAIASKRNRTLLPETLKGLPEDAKFPVSQAFPHNDHEIRCQIVVNDLGKTVSLDVPFETYQDLPSVKVE